MATFSQSSTHANSNTTKHNKEKTNKCTWKNPNILQKVLDEQYISMKKATSNQGTQIQIPTNHGGALHYHGLPPRNPTSPKYLIVYNTHGRTNATTLWTTRLPQSTPHSIIKPPPKSWLILPIWWHKRPYYLLFVSYILL